MLTWADRLSLYNQYEILKFMDPENKKIYEESQEIVSNGFEIFYSSLNVLVYEKIFSEEKAREVLDILNMFRAIEFSSRAIKYVSANYWAKFQGFDGNDEGGQYGFAKFVRRTQGKYDELSDRPDNSHSDVLEKYRDMLAVWRRLGESYELSAEQIEEIASA